MLSIYVAFELRRPRPYSTSLSRVYLAYVWTREGKSCPVEVVFGWWTFWNSWFLVDLPVWFKDRQKSCNREVMRYEKILFYSLLMFGWCLERSEDWFYCICANGADSPCDCFVTTSLLELNFILIARGYYYYFFFVGCSEEAELSTN